MPQARASRSATSAASEAGESSAAGPKSDNRDRISPPPQPLLRAALERSYRVGNILAETRDRATVRGGERVVAALLQRLARAGATRLDFSILGAAHRPYRLHARGL